MVPTRRSAGWIKSNSGANTPEQLAQAYSLEGATLPDEQILKKSDDSPNGWADR
jgi:hypothetical protein